MTPPTPALHGLRVLDFTQNLPGPYATHILAQQGADVVKVEPPRGDPARMTPALFARLNAGKRSVRLDLKRPEALERARALAARADVIVEGFRPGVMARFGLGGEQCSRAWPRLVYCSISGYGQEGPYRDRPSHDLNLQAVSGFCDLERDADEVPRATVLPIADLSAGLTAALLIMNAVLARSSSGKGTLIDVALSDTLSAWVSLWNEGMRLPWPQPEDVATRLREDSPARRWIARAGAFGVWGQAMEAARRSAWIRELKRLRLYAVPHYRLFATADRPVSLGVLDEARFWEATAKALGLSRLATLPLWTRLALRQPIGRLLASRLRRRSAAAWLRDLDPERVPVTPVLAADEVADDAHMRARLRGLPFLSNDADARGPELGEHDEALLAGWS